MAGRFRSGDHLKVRRPRGYDHRGIYISDDRVIQFGSGITLTDKSRTAVSTVTLAEFAQGGTRQSNATATRAYWTPVTTRLLTKDGKSSPAPSSSSSSSTACLIT